MKNKIGWCNTTWNPVWGCLNNCEYCYARAFAKRFWKKMWIIEANHQWKEHPDWVWTGDHLQGLKDFKLTFLNAQFERKLPKKHQRIFVGSMSEIAHWRKYWMEMVLEKVRHYPQHTFQFLTKFPNVYSRYEFPKNCWLGVTIVRTPKESELNRWDFLEYKRNNLYNIKFICFEPLLEEIYLSYYLDLTAIDWVIIGAETGNRKEKIIPNLDWILEIVKYCEMRKIPVYIKDNLLKYYAGCRGYKQFPTINKL